MKLLSPTLLLTFPTLILALPSVTVDAGTIHGGKCKDGKNAVYYKGIPFAEPPVGKLRFEPPKVYSGKYDNGALNATAPAATCIQFGDDMVPPGTKSEDCLYLNVWTPANATKTSKLPVRIWVYGGSDMSGGIDYSLYDGCSIADAGSVFVSINYRLGPLGFLALHSAGIYGNQGIQDLLLGLDWVQREISAFGGDPDKVVLTGQSAGATDVYTVATLPQAPSLFKSAIIESIALPSLLTNSTVQQTGASYAQTLRCSVRDKSCLQSKTTADLQSAVDSDRQLHEGLGALNGLGVLNRNTPHFWPYVDGTVVSENPATRGIQVPTIFGYNQREGMMDTLTKYDTTKAVAALTAADYTSFLRGNWGSAAHIIQKYYPLSLFEAATNGSTSLAVLFAISTVITDSEFKCSGYQSAVQATRKNVPAWIYEFTHNSTCVWLDTMPQSAISIFGAAHTAEIPYVFGNLDFDFPTQNTTCTGSQPEWNLSKEMMSLWTAMAESAKPSTGDISWPAFKVTPKGLNTPGMIFGNSSTPGTIDFSACNIWAQVDAIVDAGNATTTSVPSSSSTRSSVSPTNGATIIFPSTMMFAAWWLFVIVASMAV
ncbi:hypothetical protein AAEP93_007779 [Penicillium crustosum]